MLGEFATENGVAMLSLSQGTPVLLVCSGKCALSYLLLCPELHECQSRELHIAACIYVYTAGTAVYCCT